MAQNDNTPQILMVVNTYAPDDGRVVFAGSLLVDMGYDVHLIGSARQKHQATVASEQHYQGVNIELVPHTTRPAQLLTALYQLLTHNLPTELPVSLKTTNLISLMMFNLWILRIGLFRAVDAIHCHDLSPLPACWLLAKIKRKPLIYDVHENVPTMYANRKGKLMTQLEATLTPMVDYVITAGHRLAKAMTERGAKDVMHIGNWKSLSDYDVITQLDTTQLRQQYNIPENSFVISFIGTLDTNRELPPLLDAVANSDDIYLMIGGRGAYQDLAIEYAEKFSNIIWLGWINLDDLPLYTVTADAMYYCRSDDMPGGSYDLAPAPNKLYEAFAAELPLIASRGVGEIGEILDNIPAAILLDTVTPETIKQAIAQLRDPEIYHEKQQASRNAREQYNLAKSRERLATVYHSLLDIN